MLPLSISAVSADATVSGMLPQLVLKCMYFVSLYYAVYLDKNLNKASWKHRKGFVLKFLHSQLWEGLHPVDETKAAEQCNTKPDCTQNCRLHLHNASIQRSYFARHLALKNTAKASIMKPRQVFQKFHLTT